MDEQVSILTHDRLLIKVGKRGSRNKNTRPAKLCEEMLIIESYIEILLIIRSTVWLC